MLLSNSSCIWYASAASPHPSPSAAGAQGHDWAEKKRVLICKISFGNSTPLPWMSDRQSKLYWDPLRDDRWDLSLQAWREAAGDTWYAIRRWCHGCRWLPPIPFLPHSFPPLEWEKNGSAVSGSQRTFISPHLCGLRRDDLGLQPSQPSWHLRKKRGLGAGMGWRGNGKGRVVQTGEGWRLQKEDGKETGGSEHGVSIPAVSFYCNEAAEACLVETLCTAACSAHICFSVFHQPGQRKCGILFWEF